MPVTRHRAWTDTQANRTPNHLIYKYELSFHNHLLFGCHNRHVARLHILIIVIIMLVHQLSIYPFVVHGLENAAPNISSTVVFVRHCWGLVIAYKCGCWCLMLYISQQWTPLVPRFVLLGIVPHYCLTGLPGSFQKDRKHCTYHGGGSVNGRKHTLAEMIFGFVIQCRITLQ